MIRLLPVVLLLTACSQTNLADVLKAAATDPATICGNAMYAGASVNFSRTNIQNGTVTCDNGRLSIQSTPPTQVLGVQISPVPSGTLNPYGPGTPPVYQNR